MFFFHKCFIKKAHFFHNSSGTGLFYNFGRQTLIMVNLGYVGSKTMPLSQFWSVFPVSKSSGSKSDAKTGLLIILYSEVHDQPLVHSLNNMPSAIWLDIGSRGVIFLDVTRPIGLMAGKMYSPLTKDYSSLHFSIILSLTL